MIHARRTGRLRGIVAAALGAIWLACAAAPGSPATRIVPGGADATNPAGIRLVDQEGRPFTLAQLHGRPLLLTFIATRCTDACPIADAAFLGLQRDLDRRHLDAELVTVTLDPRHDTPFVMARTASEIGADPRRWRFASGTVSDVQRLLTAFGVVVEPDAHGIPDVHSTFVFLIGSDGRLRRTLLLSTNFRRDALDALLAIRRTTAAGAPSPIASARRD